MDGYKNYDNKMKRKLNNLIKVLEIINSKSTDEVKAILVCKIYDSSYKFIMDYIDVYKYYENDVCLLEISSKIDAVYDVLMKYEELGIFNKANCYIKNEKYLENLDFCRMIVNDYISLGSSYSEKEFLEMIGISKKIFDFAINTIKVLDRDLYNVYLERVKSNKELNVQKNILIIKDLANGIKNGILEDGTEFSLLEFIIRVPFKLEGFFCGSIEKFMKDNNLPEYNIVSKYIHHNKLSGRNVFQPLEVWTLYSGDIYVGGHKMTALDNDIILEYMVQNDLPFIRKVYNIIRAKYLAGEITKDNFQKNNSYKKLLRKKYSSYIERIEDIDE